MSLNRDTMASLPTSASSQHTNDDTILQIQLLTDSVCSHIQQLFIRQSQFKPTSAQLLGMGALISPTLPGTCAESDAVYDAVMLARQHLEDSIQQMHDLLDSKKVPPKRKRLGY